MCRQITTLLITCMSFLCAWGQYDMQFTGTGTPNMTVLYYEGEILKEGYTLHRSISFANCCVIRNNEQDTIRNINIYYTKGDSSPFDTPFHGWPYYCGDSAYYGWSGSFDNVIITNTNNRPHPGRFIYPNLKTDLPVGVYQDTMVVTGTFRDGVITFRFFLEQTVAHFTEVYIERGESYPFEGQTYTEPGRYQVGTEILDLHVVEPCEVHIQASDTFLTQPGQVELTTDLEGDYYQWTGYGLDFTTIRTPTATIDVDDDLTYQITVQAMTETGPNLATNGNFEEGNTGFQSDYQYMTPNYFSWAAMPHINSGRYSIVAFPNQANVPWTTCLYDGYMMVVDGASTPKTVYAATVTVEPHTYYAFACDLASVTNVASKVTQPHLQFFINGVTFSEIYEPTLKECDWHKFYRIWYSEDLSGEIDISLINTQTASGGNDMAMDNVIFRKLCIATDTLLITADFTPEISCETHITASKTETYCNDSVQLNIDSEADSIRWEGYGLSEVDIPNPMVHFDQAEDSTYTYVVKTYTHYGRVRVCEARDTIYLPHYNPPTTPTILTVDTCDTYTFKGQTYTESDIYTFDTIATNGCDSIVELHLTIHPSSRTYETIHACDSFLWHGHTYTASGTYTFDTLSQFGCDSTLVLQLTVSPNQTHEESQMEYQQFTWKGQTYTASGNYTFDTLTRNGCDSLMTLHLTIVDTPFVANLQAVSDYCADDQTIALEYKLQDVLLAPQNAIVSWQSPLLRDTLTSILNGTILIPIPDSIRPDYYEGTLSVLYNTYQQDLPFTVLIRYPSSVIGQKWNNVLALRNSRYNGGYDWDAYRWFVDEVEIHGETQSFIYCGENNTLQMGHPYYASLRRVGENYFIPTCPIVPVLHTDQLPIPTFFHVGSPISIRKDDKDILITIYDLLGRKIATGTTINAPSVPGTYILQTDNETHKILVQ